MSAPLKPLPVWADVVLIPLINVGAAFFIAGLVVTAIGENPFQAVRLLIAGALGDLEGIGFTLYYATSFIFTGLAVAVCFHAGLFNIGVDGQAYIGGLGAALVCLYLGFLPGYSLVIVAILAAALFGAAFAAIPGYLQAKRDSHIVITTIMFNYIASALMGYLLVDVLRARSQMNPETPAFPQNGIVPQFHTVLAHFGVHWPVTPLNLSFLLALAAAIGVWVLIWRTRLGYEIRTVGANATAAVYGGVSPARIVMVTTLLSGALAGGMAVNVILGEEHRLILEFTAGFGFVGIAVALMGRGHPVGIVLAAILFGILYQGGAELAFDMPKISRDMIVVIQGLVVLFAGALEHLFRRPVAALLARRITSPPIEASRRMDTFNAFIVILDSGVRLGVPLILACLAGLWSERSGVVDIGLEGKMLTGAFAGAAFATFTGSAWLGLVGGVVVTVCVSLIHGYASIDQRADQIVSGTAINMVAAGLTALIGNAIWSQGGRTPELPNTALFNAINLPFAQSLGHAPILGPIYQHLISGHDLITYFAFAVVPFTYWALYRTRFGLRLRAVGENPAAVDTAGISVRGLRYSAVVICGGLVGLSGVYLSVSQAGYFQPNMSAGKGFIALAALVFAKWRPWPALATCLLFGSLDALSIRLQGTVLPGIGEVPVQAIEALPYILTVVLLAGFIGKAIPPKASGVPYVKER